MLTKPNSSSNFEFEIKECFNESIDLSSIFELFSELSHLTPTKNTRESNHRFSSKQNRTGSTLSLQKSTEQAIAQSGNDSHDLKKSQNCCYPTSVITHDAIQTHILKCSREMMKDFSFADGVDIIDVREHFCHDASFSGWSDDEGSVGTEFSYQSVDSIEYTKARLPHLCHHND
jgi:hypothetical protein